MIKVANKRTPFDNKYLLGLVWQQRQMLLVAGVCLVACTCSNLAAPVLSGMLLETLVKQAPMENYGKVRTCCPMRKRVSACMRKQHSMRMKTDARHTIFAHHSRSST